MKQHRDSGENILVLILVLALVLVLVLCDLCGSILSQWADLVLDQGFFPQSSSSGCALSTFNLADAHGKD